MTNYRWQKNQHITQLLGEIEVLRRVFAVVPIVPSIEEKLLRTSLLKSAVYSAKVEGIPSTENEPRAEAQNLLAAYEKIFKNAKDLPKFNLAYVEKLHDQTLHNLNPDAGKLRTEPWAVYNQAGVALHIAPPHFQLPELMIRYVDYINGLYDHPAEIAAVAQFILEKIHPFADGNGRVGRLVSAYWLAKTDYNFRGLLMLEEYIEKHKGLYYDALVPGQDMTEFVEFFLKSIVDRANAALERIKQSPQEPDGEFMLPRRSEILAILRDHPQSTFDFLSRRFSAVNPKSLHYDLAWLLKKKLVKKLGVTRGVVYETA